MTGQYKHLLSPIDVGPFTLRNRVLVTANVPGVETGGHVNDDYIAYQRARARGGAALQISGSTAVHRTGAVGTGRGLNASDDSCIDGYQQLASAIHQHDGRFLVQLGHAGANVADTDAGRPLLAPSPIMSRLSRETPKQMTISEIDELVDAHGMAAARVRRGGLDGVELLSAFGYLPAAFLSPYSNTRTDEYGGSLENRMRFLLRTIDAMRTGLGRNHIFGVRLPGDEKVASGLTQSDLQDIAALIARSGHISTSSWAQITIVQDVWTIGRRRRHRTACSFRWQRASSPMSRCLCSRPGVSPIRQWLTRSSSAVMPIWLA